MSPMPSGAMQGSGLSEESKMKQGLSIAGLIAMGVGLNIGAAIFLTPPIMAGIAGSGLVFARLLSALPVVLSIPSLVMLSSAYPVNGGQYRYGKLFSVPWAVGMFWLYAFGILFGCAFMSLGTGIYVNQMLPFIPVTLASFLIITAIYLLNLFGIKLAGWVQVLLTALTVGALFLFIIPGLPAVSAANLKPVLPHGITGVITVAALTFNICGGGMGQLSFGKETKDAQRSNLIAVPFALIIVIIISVLVEVVAYGTIGWEALAAGNTLVPAFQSYMPFVGAIVLFSVAGPFFASASTIQAEFASVSREWMVGGEDRVFPKFLHKVNARFGTPHWAMTVFYIAASIILLFNPSVRFLSAMLTIGMMGTYILMVMGGCTLEKRYPEIYEKALYKPNRTLLWVTSILASIIIGVFMVMALIDLKWWSVPIILIVVGGILYSLKRAKDGDPVSEL